MMKGNQYRSGGGDTQAAGQSKVVSLLGPPCATSTAVCSPPGLRTVVCRMEVEGKNCNAEKRAGYVPGHQLNQRCASSFGPAKAWLLCTWVITTSHLSPVIWKLASVSGSMTRGLQGDYPIDSTGFNIDLRCGCFLLLHEGYYLRQKGSTCAQVLCAV